MTLFLSSELAPKERPIGDERRPRRRIATGTMRLTESPNERAARVPYESWASFLAEIRQSCRARIELLSEFSDKRRLPCPWSRIERCNVHCRCEGTETVTVAFLRDHFQWLALRIKEAATPVSVRSLFTERERAFARRAAESRARLLRRKQGSS